MLESEGEFGEGLLSLLRNDAEDAVGAEAALNIIAETLLLHRAWLRANTK